MPLDDGRHDPPSDALAAAARDYSTPHHYDWIERFVKLVARAVKLAEPVTTLPPFALPPPPDVTTAPAPELPVIGTRIKLGEAGWVWPMERSRDNRAPTISDGRHAKGDMRFRNGKGHRGVDIMYRKPKRAASASLLNHPWESLLFEVLPRTHALCAAPGKVTVSRWLATGFVVAVDHGFGVETAYHHLSAALVNAGDELGAGDWVGFVGAPPATKPGGRPGLVHLHFDLLVGGKFVDPEPYMKTWAIVAPPKPAPNVA